MPYHIFRISPRGVLEPLTSFDDYRSAKRDVAERRRRLVPGDGYTVRMIHAGDEAQARQLLSEKREPRPLGEDG